MASTKPSTKASPRPIRRIAFPSLLSQADHVFISGVVDYQSQVDHWRFVGERGNPFITIDQLDPAKVDGIVGNFYEPRWVDAVVASGIAAVNTSTSNCDPRLAQVGNDDAATGRMGAEHLLGRGFTQFGFVGFRGPAFSQVRRDALTEVIEDAGRQCHEFWCEHYTQAANMGPFTEWLAAIPKPIALMAVTDHFGFMALEAAATLGLRVPDDVAVLGVDNELWVTMIAEPPMSSVQTDMRQVAYQAAKLLDALMDGEAPPPPRLVPPVGVVTRRSTDVVLVDDPIVTRALAYIRDHCAQGINVDDVLDELDLSRRNLELRVKRVTGRTPLAEITRARVERARQLLVGSDMSMNEIAEAAGFTQRARFFKAFKRQTGLTPGRYRQRRGGLTERDEPRAGARGPRPSDRG